MFQTYTIRTAAIWQEELNMNRNSLKAAAWILAAISLAGQARAAEENPVLLRFDTSVLSYAAHDGQVPTTNNFTPWGGKPLSADTVAEEISSHRTSACGRGVQVAAHRRHEPGGGVRGGEGVAGSPRGLFLLGDGQELGPPFARAGNPAGDRGGRRRRGGGTQQAPACFPWRRRRGRGWTCRSSATPTRRISVTVNFEPGQTTLFINVVQVGVAGNIVWPTTPKRLVFGQLGPGPGPNKHLESLTTYKRPLTRGEEWPCRIVSSTQSWSTWSQFRLSKGPVIDGVMDDAAWKNAAVLSGMVNDFRGRWMAFRPDGREGG